MEGLTPRWGLTERDGWGLGCGATSCSLLEQHQELLKLPPARLGALGGTAEGRDERGGGRCYQPNGSDGSPLSVNSRAKLKMAKQILLGYQDEISPPGG